MHALSSDSGFVEQVLQTSDFGQQLQLYGSVHCIYEMANLFNAFL